MPRARRYGAHWSSGEKMRLLMALHKHGPSNVAIIARSLHNRTESEVAAKIGEYKRRAEAGADNRPNDYRNDNLAAWINVLSTSRKPDSFLTQLPTALRLIARLERHPTPEQLNGIDLESLYLHLASAIEDGSVNRLKTKPSKFLARCLEETDNKVKMMSNEQLKDYLQNITRIFPNLKEPQMTVVSEKSDALKEILSSIAYNPLEIPDYFLTRTSDYDVNTP